LRTADSFLAKKISGEYESLHYPRKIFIEQTIISSSFSKFRVDNLPNVRYLWSESFYSFGDPIYEDIQKTRTKSLISDSLAPEREFLSIKITFKEKV
jgi:hypothetical protein